MESRITELTESHSLKKATLEFDKRALISLKKEGIKSHPKRREEMLLYEEGKFCLHTAARSTINFERDLSVNSSVFQMNRKLYVNCSITNYKAIEAINFLCFA